MIGNNIKKRRLELGLTQDELAKKMGYKSRSAINKMEKNVNDINQSTLKKLGEALEINPVDLMDYHLQAEFEQTKRVAAYAELFSALSPDNQDIILKTMQAMKPTRANIGHFDVTEELKKHENRKKG